MANFHFEKLAKYCTALANEGVGSVVLGVTDKRPRRVVGSQVLTELEQTKAGLMERLRLRIEAEEILHVDGRVLIFTAPARPIGMPIVIDGAYWMRAGEDLAPMTPDMLRRIFEEAGPDFWAEICPTATLAELDLQGHRGVSPSLAQPLAQSRPGRPFAGAIAARREAGDAAWDQGRGCP